MTASFSKRLFGALMALGAALPALAYTPADGTLTDTSGPITTSGGPYAASNPSPVPLVGGGPICDAPELCDIFTLTLDLPQGFRDANPNLVVQFDLTWTQPAPAADDLDMYIYDDQGNLIGQSATGDPSESTQVSISKIPSTAEVRMVPYTVTGSTSDLTMTLVAGAGSDPSAPDPCAMTGETTAQGDTIIDPEVAQDFTLLGAQAPYGAFVHFNAGTNKDQDALLETLGAVIKGDFRRYAKSVFVQAPVGVFFTLMDSPLVSRIEYNRPIHLTGDTQSWATRVRVAQEYVSGGPWMDDKGQIITGLGTTLGVIDSGLQGSHADFADNLLHNFKLVDAGGVGAPIPTYIDVGNTNSENAAGGHGTHVTGTVAGRGVESTGLYPVSEVAPNIQGTFTGAAPDAQLIHWAHGAGLFVLSAVTAYQHILDNEQDFVPKLRAVNNSYGSDPGPYSPSATSSCLIKEIVTGRNIVMAFAAGNDGGDGSETATSPTCKDPTPGVICVASYNDLGTGDVNAELSGFSSRGLESDPTDYPDIAAPGDTITSTCLQADGTQAICVGGTDNAVETQWFPWHGTISGTSMATPHITGIVGLMTQVDPDLTPAEIELIIQRNARKVGDGYVPDPQHPGETTHFGFGAGLVDVPAILADIGATPTGLPPAGEEFVVIDGDVDGGDATDVVTVSLQDVTRDGVMGIVHRLTLADAASGVGTGVSYEIQRNVAGLAFATTVVLGPDGVTIPASGEGNTAVASSATLDGNVLSVFVPYEQMNTPAVGEPIHNIRVLVDGGADIAPSDSNMVNQPQYGRAFTVQLTPAQPPVTGGNPPATGGDTVPPNGSSGALGLGVLGLLLMAVGCRRRTTG